MAQEFDVTAKINFAVSGIQNAAIDIKRKLGVIQGSVKIDIPKGITSNLDGINQKLIAMRTNLDNVTSSATSATNAMIALSNSFRGLNTHLSTIRSSAPVATQRMKEHGAVIQKTALDMEEFGRISGLAFRRFMAFSIPAAFTAGITMGLRAATKEAVDFQNAMIQLQQVTGQTQYGLKDLENTIGNLSMSMGVSSKELSQVARILAQAGLSAKDTKVAMEAIAATDVAPTFENMTETTEGAIAAMQQFGLGADELKGKLGSLNAVAAAFAVESSDIISAIRHTGGAFKAAGGDLEELMALFTSVRQTTRESADSIATGFRTIFTRMQRPRTIEFLKEIGVNLQDMSGKFVRPYEAVKRLHEAMKDLSSTDIRYPMIMEELGGYRQISKVVPLIQKFDVAQKAYAVAMAGTNSLVDTQTLAMDSLARKFTMAKEEWLKLIREMMSNQAIKDLINDLLKLSSTMVEVVRNLEPMIPIFKNLALIQTARFAMALIPGIKNIHQPGQQPPKLGQSLTGMEHGGSVKRYAGGGYVPGPLGAGDIVPAMMEPGEFVLKRSSAESIGYDNLHKMNKAGKVRFSSGGGIRKFADGGTPDEDLFIRMYGKRVYDEKMSKFFSGQDVDYTPFAKRYTNLRNTPFSFIDERKIEQIKKNKFLESFFSEQSELLGYGAEGTAWTKGQDVYRLGIPVTANTQDLLNFQKNKISRHQHSRILQPNWFTQIGNIQRGDLTMRLQGWLDEHKRTSQSFPLFLEQMQRIIPFDNIFGRLPIASMLRRELKKDNLNYWDKPKEGTNFGYNPHLKRFQVYDPGAVRLSTLDDFREDESSTFAMAGFGGGGFVQRFAIGGETFTSPYDYFAREITKGESKVDLSKQTDVKLGLNTPFWHRIRDASRSGTLINEHIKKYYPQLLLPIRQIYGNIRSGRSVQGISNILNANPKIREALSLKQGNLINQEDINWINEKRIFDITTIQGKQGRKFEDVKSGQLDIYLGRNLNRPSFGGLFLEQGTDNLASERQRDIDTKANEIIRSKLKIPDYIKLDNFRTRIGMGFINPGFAGKVKQTLEQQFITSIKNTFGEYIKGLNLPPEATLRQILSTSGMNAAVPHMYEGFLSSVHQGVQKNEDKARWDIPKDANRQALKDLFGPVAGFEFLDAKSVANENSIVATNKSIVSKAVEEGLEQGTSLMIPFPGKNAPQGYERMKRLRVFNKNITSFGQTLPANIGRLKQKTPLGNIHPDDFVFEEHNGGVIQHRKFASGGESEDTVPALLTPGEFVFTKAASQSIGYSNLNTLNREGLGGLSKVRGYAKGGYVQKFAAENEERKVLPLSEIRKEIVKNATIAQNAGSNIMPRISISIDKNDIDTNKILAAVLNGTSTIEKELGKIIERKVLEDLLKQTREVVQQLEQQSKQTQTQTTSRRGWNKNPRTGAWATERQLEQEKVRQIAEEMGLEVRETKTGEQRFYGYTRGGKRGSRLSSQAVLDMAKARQEERMRLYDERLAKQNERSQQAKEFWSNASSYERYSRREKLQKLEQENQRKQVQSTLSSQILNAGYITNQKEQSYNIPYWRILDQKTQLPEVLQPKQFGFGGFFNYMQSPTMAKPQIKYGRDEAFTGGLINIRQPAGGRFGSVPNFAGGAFGGAGFGGLGGTMLLSMIAGQFSDDKSPTGQMIQKLSGWGAGFAATKMLTNLGIEQQATKAIGTMFGDKQGRLEWKTLGMLGGGNAKYRDIKKLALASGMSKEAAHQYAQQQILSLVPTKEEITDLSQKQGITDKQALKQLYQQNVQKTQVISRKQRIGMITAGVTSVTAPLLATGFTMYGGSQQEEARKKALEIGSNPAELAKLESQYKAGGIFSKMGVGLGTGAAIGGLVGGPVGAAVGAGVGAGAGLIMALSENTNEIKKLNSQGIAAQAATDLNDIFSRITTGRSLSLYGDTEALKGRFNTQIQEIKNTAALGESTKELTIQLKAAAPAADYLKNELIKTSSSTEDFWKKLKDSGIDLVDVFSRINNMGTEQVRKMLERDAKEGIEREQNSKKLKGVLVESELTQRAFRIFTYQLEQLSEDLTKTSTIIETIVGYQNPGNITAATYRSTGIFARAGAAEFVNMEDYGKEVQKLYGNLPNLQIKEWIMEIGRLSQTLPDILQGAVKAGVSAEDLGTQVQKALNVNPAAPDMSPIGITRRVISEQINSMMASRQAGNSLTERITVNAKEIVAEIFKDSGKTAEFVEQQSKLLESTTKQVASFYQQQTQQLIAAEEQRLNIVKQTVAQEEVIAGMRASLMKEPLSPEFTLRGVQRQQSATLAGTGLGGFDVAGMLGGLQVAQQSLLSLQFKGSGISLLGTGNEKNNKEAENAFMNHMKAMQASQLEVDKFKRALTGVIEASDKMINTYKQQIDKIQQDREARFGILTRYAGAPFEEQQKILRTIAQTRYITEQGQEKGGKFFWGQTADDRSAIINLAQSLANTQAGAFGGITGTQFIERFINDRLGGRINKNLGVFQGTNINAQDLIKENASITEFNRKQEEYISKIGEWQGKQIEAMQVFAKIPQDAAINIGIAIEKANQNFLTEFARITTEFVTNSYKSQITQKETERDVLKQRQQAIFDIAGGKFGDIQSRFPEISKDRNLTWIQQQDKYFNLIKMLVSKRGDIETLGELKNIPDLKKGFKRRKEGRSFSQLVSESEIGSTIEQIPTQSEIIAKMFGISIKDLLTKRTASETTTFLEQQPFGQKYKGWMGQNDTSIEVLAGKLSQGNIAGAFSDAEKMFNEITKKREELVKSFLALTGSTQDIVDKNGEYLPIFEQTIRRIELFGKEFFINEKNITELNKKFEFVGTVSAAQIGTQLETLSETIRLLNERLQKEPPLIGAGPNQNKTGEVAAVVAEQKQIGGTIFKARGTDTVPAMLTPGEFVVNAKSAQENKQVLNKINSGAKVKSIVYAAEGGLLESTRPTEIPYKPFNGEEQIRENIDRLIRQREGRSIEIVEPNRLPSITNPFENIDWSQTILDKLRIFQENIIKNQLEQLDPVILRDKTYKDIQKEKAESYKTGRAYLAEQYKTAKSERRKAFEEGRGEFYKGREDRKTNFNREEYDRIFGVKKGEQVFIPEEIQLEQALRKSQAEAAQEKNMRWIKEHRGLGSETATRTKTGDGGIGRLISYKERDSDRIGRLSGVEFRNYDAKTQFASTSDISWQKRDALVRAGRMRGTPQDMERLAFEDRMKQGRQNIGTGIGFDLFRKGVEAIKNYGVTWELRQPQSTTIKPIEDNTDREFKTFANSGFRGMSTPLWQRQRGLGQMKSVQATDEIIGSTDPRYVSPAEKERQRQVQERIDRIKKLGEESRRLAFENTMRGGTGQPISDFEKRMKERRDKISGMSPISRPLTMVEQQAIAIERFAREHGLPGLRTTGVKLIEDKNYGARAGYRPSDHTIRFNNPRPTTAIHEYGHVLSTRYGSKDAQGNIIEFSESPVISALLQKYKLQIQRAAQEYSRKNNIPITGNITSNPEMLSFLMEGTDSSLLPLRAYLIEQMRLREKDLQHKYMGGLVQYKVDGGFIQANLLHQQEVNHTRENLKKNRKRYFEHLHGIYGNDVSEDILYFMKPSEQISFSENFPDIMQVISNEIQNKNSIGESYLRLPTGYRTGGVVQKKHTGGFVTGIGDVPVMAQGGEFILDRRSAKHFAQGGLVQYRADGGVAEKVGNIAKSVGGALGEISINGIDSLDKISQVFISFISKSDGFVRGLDAGFTKFQSSIQSFEGAVGKLKDAFSTKIEISVTHNPIEVIVNGQVTGPDKDSIRQIVMETIGPELENLTRNIKEFGPNALA